MSKDEWAKFAVEIRIAMRNGIAWGSGYVTSSFRILTALHVVVDEKFLRKGVVKPLDGILVRAYGDFIEKFPEVMDYNVERVLNRFSSDPNQDNRWRPAKLAWPLPDGEAPPLDLAILELKETDSLPFTRRLIPVRCSDPGDNIRCRGIGFPTWTFLSTDEGTNLPRPTPISGTLSLGARGLGAMHPFRVTSGAPPAEEKWKGLSGTGLFEFETMGLIGVVSRTEVSSDNAVLQMTLLADATAPMFDQMWQASGLRPPPTAGPDLTAHPDQLVDATTAFGGFTARGPSTSFPVYSWEEYRREFGLPCSRTRYFLDFAVRGFFDNGGEYAYIVRVIGRDSYRARAEVSTSDGLASLVLEARSTGSWGNRLSVSIRHGSRVGFHLTLELSGMDLLADPMDQAGDSQPVALEQYDNLSLDRSGPNPLCERINSRSEFIHVRWQGEVLEEASLLAGKWELAGGSDGKPTLGDFTGEQRGEGETLSGLMALHDRNDVASICVPDLASRKWCDSEREGITAAIVLDCRDTKRLAVLSSREQDQDPTSITAPPDSEFAAVYFPWVNVLDSQTGEAIAVPAVGHIAGALARWDRDLGVHTCPIDLGVVGLAPNNAVSHALTYVISDMEAHDLGGKGVNVLRVDAKRPERVFLGSAITAAIDDDKRPLQLRRLSNFIDRAIAGAMHWTIFAANDEATWRDVAYRVEEFLFRLWKAGALRGHTPEEAFFVRCDQTTMTENDIMNGRIIPLIGFAPADNRLSVPRPVFQALRGERKNVLTPIFWTLNSG
jgi:uncharacterized protein